MGIDLCDKGTCNAHIKDVFQQISLDMKSIMNENAEMANTVKEKERENAEIVKILEEKEREKIKRWQRNYLILQVKSLGKKKKVNQRIVKKKSGMRSLANRQVEKKKVKIKKVKNM